MRLTLIELIVQKGSCLVAFRHGVDLGDYYENHE